MPFAKLRAGSAPTWVWMTKNFWRWVVETLLQVVVVAGGLVFSFAVAILIEELLFGQIFRMVFGKRAVLVAAEAAKSQSRR